MTHLGRLLLWALLLLASPAVAQTQLPLFGVGGQQAVKLVQHIGANGTSVTLNGTTAHNSLIIGISFCYNASCNTNSGVTIASVTDTNSNSCAAVAGANTLSAAVFPAIAYLCPNISTAVNVNDTITVNYTGSPQFPVIFVSEWSGLRGVGEKGNGTAPGGSPSSVNVSTNGAVTGSNELIWGWAILNGCTIVSSNTGIDGATVNVGEKDSYQIGTTPNTYTNTWTCSSGTGNPTAIIAGFPAK